MTTSENPKTSSVEAVPEKGQEAKDNPAPGTTAGTSEVEAVPDASGTEGSEPSAST